MCHSKIITLSLFLFISINLQIAKANIVESSWQLKEELLSPSNIPQNENAHQIKFSAANKQLFNLKLNTKKQIYSFDEQNIPGLVINYNYQFKFEKIWTAIYSNLGYFTTYNNLGTQGYADLSIIDAYLGVNIGIPLFSQKVLPKIFAGIGHGYYFQRGDVKEVSADKNYNEIEMGVSLDYFINTKSAFPTDWNTKYILGISAARFQTTNSQELLEGNKILASLGVEL